jgi:RNA polymerase sigma-70 factor (ECF subfamily)
MDGPLVQAARGGSQAAFSRLVQRHQQSLRGFLRRLISSRPDEADDLAQEAFLAAWSNLSRLREADDFRPWLFGIAYRKAQSALRSGRRQARRDGAWLAVEAQAAEPALDPDLRLSLDKALRDLDPEQRAAVQLCLAEGWTHPEAAQALGLPLGTIKSHVARGRARLLAELGEAT